MTEIVSQLLMNAGSDNFTRVEKREARVDQN